jgi:hypothetical protein
MGLFKLDLLAGILSSGPVGKRCTSLLVIEGGLDSFELSTRRIMLLLEKPLAKTGEKT